MYSKKKKKKKKKKGSIPSSIQKWELLQGIQTQGSIITEKTRQFSNPGRLYILLENKNIQLGMDYLRHDQRSKKKKERKVKH